MFLECVIAMANFVSARYHSGLFSKCALSMGLCPDVAIPHCWRITTRGEANYRSPILNRVLIDTAHVYRGSAPPVPQLVALPVGLLTSRKSSRASASSSVQRFAYPSLFRDEWWTALESSVVTFASYLKSTTTSSPFRASPLAPFSCITHAIPKSALDFFDACACVREPV